MANLGFAQADNPIRDAGNAGDARNAGNAGAAGKTGDARHRPAWYGRIAGRGRRQHTYAPSTWDAGPAWDDAWAAGGGRPACDAWIRHADPIGWAHTISFERDVGGILPASLPITAAFGGVS